MSEILPESIPEPTDTSIERTEPEPLAQSVQPPIPGIPLSQRAKITAPLREAGKHTSIQSTPRVTRPLMLEETDIQAAAPALELSLPGAQITRPLARLTTTTIAEDTQVIIPITDEESSAEEIETEKEPVSPSMQAPAPETAPPTIHEIVPIVSPDVPSNLDQLEQAEEISSLDQSEQTEEISASDQTAEEISDPDQSEQTEEIPSLDQPEQTGEISDPEHTEQISTLDQPGQTGETSDPDLSEQTGKLIAQAEETIPTSPLEIDQGQNLAHSTLSKQLTGPLEVTRIKTIPFKGKELQLQPATHHLQTPYTPLLTSVPRTRLKRIYRLQYFSRKHLRLARVNDRRERRRLWTTIWTTTISLFLLFVVITSITSYIAYNFIVATQGTYAGQVLTLRDLLPPDNLKIYDSQGNIINQMTDQGIHTEVPYKQIAPDLLNATVAIEDHTFWQNSGVDITGILRAAVADLNNGQQVQGGSTITQQLIKKLIVGDSDDAKRKLDELVLAPQVNNHYSKQDILEMYLNTIYYGHQAYGIDAAATVYFGLVDKNGRSAASQLDLAQSAMLAGLPRNASLYDPITNFATATSRFYDVLQAMVTQRYITQVQAQNAYQEEQAKNFFQSSTTLQDQAPHFDEYVLTQLEQRYHLTRAQLSRSGLVVYTTLNIALQKQILKIMQQHIAEIRAAHHVTNAAEVLIDFHTGAIISMLGSIDYNNRSIDGQFNVALAYRQPGSSFKPYVYVTAFAQGASPAQAVDDASTTFNVPDSNPPTYTPSNYDQHFHGHMTLRCALQNSLNVPAVRVLQHVGINNAMATAQAMGITSYEGTPGFSLVLGGLDVRLLDHTSAIGVFANNGVRQPYYSISKIVQGTTGKVLFQQQVTAGTQVLSPQLSYMMTNVLSDNTSRIPEFFDCNVLQLYANSQQDCYNGNRGAVRPAAAKTGTTQDFRDNWTVGYTTDFVMGVWAGNDDNSPMINVTGVQGAAPIWHDAMLLAEKDHPIQDFQNPGGLQQATVTYPDGVKSTDLFLPGTVPPDGKQVSTLNPGQDEQPATTTPYCSTFSYAFQPPAGSGIPADNKWW